MTTLVKKTPQINTSLPGPVGQGIVDTSNDYVTPSLPRAYNLTVKRAKGCWVEDLDGNQFLDCAAGIAVCSTGHCHPTVVDAIKNQAENLLHICGADYYEEQYITLAERLANLAPGGGDGWKVFLGNSGAEAVEAAIKLARHHTGRPYIISFYGAFHGRTMGAVSLTASKPIYHNGFGPLLAGVKHAHYAYCYRCPFNQKYPECNLACANDIEETLFGKVVAPEEVAAIFVEPVQGEGGYIVPPDGWLQKIREICDKYDILMVADEVQSGIGRTGKLWAIENWDVVPDIVCSAKAIASGMPLSAMMARDEVMTWPPGAHGSTYGGNPVSCAAAQATLDVLENENLMENAVKVGGYFVQKLNELAEVTNSIGDVRGLGLMVGVELVKDKKTKAAAKKLTEELMVECFNRGLLVLPCGPNSLRFSPPLTITMEEAAIAFDIFADALAFVEAQ